MSLGKKRHRVKVKLGAGLGVFRHHQLTKSKNIDSDKEKTGLFVSSEKTLTKKVRMPKNHTAQKIKKKENADVKNHSDAIATIRVRQISPLWEAWCKYDSQVSFSKFEREIMKFRAYKKRLDIVKSKMNTPA